jgi:phosphohistidine phosphatase
MSPRRQLFVLRHAKSSWDDPGLPDHDRPLAPRGRRAVKVLARHIADSEIRPAQVICSSARRTVQTYEGVAPGGDLLVEPELYGATADEILARLRRVPEETRSVMLIGHNPGLQTLLLTLSAADGHAPLLAEVQRNFPTGTLATLSFECSWSALAAGRAKLESLVRPTDLH